MIDVKNFFRFIANKNPKYSGKESVKSLYNGFIIPMDGESTIDEENLTLNGRFGNVNIHNYKNNVWHIREFVDGEIKSYYVQVKMDNIQGEMYLESVYVYGKGVDGDAIVRRFKMMGEGDTEPTMHEHPKDDVDDFSDLQFDRNREDTDYVLQYFQDILEDNLDENEKEWIKDNVDFELEDIFAPMDLVDFSWGIRRIYENGGGPYIIDQIYYYLTEAYGSAAEYQCDSMNYLFDGDGPSNLSNIKEVRVQWPYAYLMLNEDKVSDEEGNPTVAYWDSSVDLYDSGKIWREVGLRVDLVKKYIQMYPFKIK